MGLSVRGGSGNLLRAAVTLRGGGASTGGTGGSGSPPTTLPPVVGAFVTVSGALKLAVGGSHVASSQVMAYYGATQIGPGLDLIDGSVTVDANAAVRRAYSATFAGQAAFPTPTDFTGAFAPYGTRHRVYRGVVFPAGNTEWVPLGVFRVDTPSTPIEAGPIQVTGSDLSKVVQESRFLQPTWTVTTNTIPVEIARHIRGSGLGAAQAIRDYTGSTALAPAVTWDRDRWQGLRDLALTIGAEILFGPDGTCVIRPVPKITDPPRWTINVTDIVISGDRTLDRSETYNVVVATGERTDGVAPVRAVAQDNNPASPTYVGGPYGYVPVFYSSPLLTTTVAAQKAADTILARVRGMSRQVTFQCIPDVTFDAGDVVRLVFPDGSSEVHIIDTLQIPLHPSGAMRVTTLTSTEPGLS